ncbi:hypothetical protein GCM10023116_41830 [Kistimonas scapharcae]|uniref:Flagellar protein FlgJ N-terminal domain-containing protein n=1 Tax=Kistimonas scapharcae TaxID=1036133 RepID=A0ABP8V8Z1_9GAMM
MNTLLSLSEPTALDVSSVQATDSSQAKARAVVEGFETLLWQELLNSMHRTADAIKSGDNPLSPDRSWADDWLSGIWAQAMTRHSQSGLSDHMLRQLRIEAP